MKQIFGKHLDPIFNWFWSQLGSKIRPKPSPNRWKINQKWTTKSIRILYLFRVAFWWLLGPTWLQNPSRREPGGDTFLLFLGLEKCWGILGPVFGLGGVLGASWGPFWSPLGTLRTIFEQFFDILIDFARIVKHVEKTAVFHCFLRFWGAYLAQKIRKINENSVRETKKG